MGNIRQHGNDLLRRGRDFGRSRRDTMERTGEFKSTASTNAKRADDALERSKGGNVTDPGKGEDSI